jgi:hypothetical protein
VNTPAKTPAVRLVASRPVSAAALRAAISDVVEFDGTLPMKMAMAVIRLEAAARAFDAASAPSRRSVLDAGVWQAVIEAAPDEASARSAYALSQSDWFLAALRNALSE